MAARPKCPVRAISQATTFGGYSVMLIPASALPVDLVVMLVSRRSARGGQSPPPCTPGSGQQNRHCVGASTYPCRLRPGRAASLQNTALSRIHVGCRPSGNAQRFEAASTGSFSRAVGRSNRDGRRTHGRVRPAATRRNGSTTGNVPVRTMFAGRNVGSSTSMLIPGRLRSG